MRRTAVRGYLVGTLLLAPAVLTVLTWRLVQEHPDAEMWILPETTWAAVLLGAFGAAWLLGFPAVVIGLVGLPVYLIVLRTSPESEAWWVSGLAVLVVASLQILAAAVYTWVQTYPGIFGLG